MYKVMNKKIIRDYGKIILALRTKLDISQEEMAKYFNVAFATINWWENDISMPSKIHILQKELCKKIMYGSYYHE